MLLSLLFVVHCSWQSVRHGAGSGCFDIVTAGAVHACAQCSLAHPPIAFHQACSVLEAQQPAVHAYLLQEDMEVAPDFFSYFEALTPLLDRDPSLMCISSWNDHGQVSRHAANPTPVSTILHANKRACKRSRDT